MASIAIGRAGRHRDPRRWSTARTFAVAAGAAVAVPAVLGAIWARPILALLWGPRFAAASTALSLLLVSAIPGAAISVLSPLVAVTRRSTLLEGVLAGLVVNLDANLLAIPRWGMAGAGGANLLSELVLAAWLWAGLRRDAGGLRRLVPIGHAMLTGERVPVGGSPSEPSVPGAMPPLDVVAPAEVARSVGGSPIGGSPIGGSPIGGSPVGGAPTPSFRQ
jgi:hypothetical protein